jgi:hypothetical protein
MIPKSTAEYIHAARMAGILGNADAQTDRGMLREGKVSNRDIGG